MCVLKYIDAIWLRLENNILIVPFVVMEIAIRHYSNSFRTLYVDFAKTHL